MYSVIIVEDETTMRKGIINFINWDSLDCNVVWDFRDGFEAKLFIENQGVNVDIVITDIRMPRLDGIELAHFIFESYPGIQIIILTGFEKFEYAQTAIRYNVVDFVTKTNPLEMLVPAVKKAKARIEGKREQNESIHKLQRRIINDLSIVQKKFLQDVINRVVVDESAVHLGVEQNQIRLGYYFVLLFCAEDTSQRDGMSSYKTYNSFFESIEKYIRTAFQNNRCYVIRMHSRTLCTIVGFEQNDYHRNCGCIRPTCKEIIGLSDVINVRFYIGISAMHADATHLPAAYSEAESVLRRKQGEERICFYSDVFLSINQRGHMLVSDVIRYIELHYASPDISLDSIASALHFSSVHVSRTFRHIAGKKLIDYLNEYRIEKSRELLLESDAKQYEVAELVGYKNPSYFSLLFKKQFGVTPADYKQWMKK